MQSFTADNALAPAGSLSMVAQAERAGSVLAGVMVKVINQGTNHTTNLRADEAGKCSATNPNAGGYMIEAAKAGLCRRVREPEAAQTVAAGGKSCGRRGDLVAVIAELPADAIRRDQHRGKFAPCWRGGRSAIQ